MTFDVEFLDDGGPADVTVTLSGELTEASFRELTDAITNHRQFRTGLSMLVDISALDTPEFPDEVVSELSAPIAERDWDYPPRAVAIIAPDDRRFRAAESYRAHLGGSRSKRNVFRNRDEALAWLKE